MFRSTLTLLLFLVCSAYALGQIKSNNVLIPTSSNSANTLSVQLRSLNELGSFYASSDPDSAFFYAKLAMDEALSQADDHNYAVAKRTMGEIFYLQGAYDNAISYLTDALKVFQELNATNETAQTLLALGAAYQFHDLWDKALNEYHRSRKLFLLLNDSSGLAETYGVIGHYYEKTADSDSAFFYQYKALELYQALDDSRGLAIIHDNIGSIYEDLGQFEQAYDYFLQSAKYDSVCNNLPALVNTLNNIGDTYRKRGIVEESVVYTNKALALADSLNLNYEILSAYHDLAKVYRADGQESLALMYYDSAYEFSQNLFNSQIAGQIANFQTLYETQEKEQAIVQLEAEQRIGRQTRNTVIVGSLGLIFFVTLVAIQERKRRTNATEAFKAQKALSDAKIENIELEQKALQTQLENKKLKEEQFYLELEARSQDLTTKTLHIIQKNRLLKDLREQISVLDKENKMKSDVVSKLSNSIDKGFQFDREWEHFQDSFNQVHDDFSHRIKKEFADLTESEIRLCALIRMGISSKDIATILGISTDSLRVSRYRLKKKLNTEAANKLKEFLINY
ncbi:MAG: tetratricopeptide repeat protein [Roseivirga sp.]|uniref:tetratricopeptide repeat protein n=1 Tax=Roseivirga sp. TaxID=1964215 RepID=UPI001B0A8E4C|nr:tetratricopeptide repeat protein [Roseivirga sp.]MBO6497294.1 tetratricopeptide repeat protein [Roseivirga sp.]